MKTKKLIKQALKNPESYTEAELTYLRLWRKEHKRQKQIRKTHQNK